jgi:two-component system phosphate regulon sensor histidine kinase PhoR
MQEPISILVLDEDPLTIKGVTEIIAEYQSIAIPCPSAEAILFAIQHKAVDVVIVNLQKPFQQAFDLLSEIKGNAPRVEVIFVSRFDEETLPLWMEAIRRGAYEFLPKPLDLIELKRVLIQATEKHHPVGLRKRPPAESVKHLSHKRKASSGAS